MLADGLSQSFEKELKNLSRSSAPAEQPAAHAQ